MVSSHIKLHGDAAPMESVSVKRGEPVMGQRDFAADNAKILRIFNDPALKKHIAQQTRHAGSRLEKASDLDSLAASLKPKRQPR